MKGQRCQAPESEASSNWEGPGGTIDVSVRLIMPIKVPFRAMWLLEISHLTKSYARPGGDGDRHRVVDIAAFSVAAGAQVALRGESGTGKTTFLNLIAGI